MDRQPAPGGVGGLGPPGERADEVAVVELDLEGHAGEVLCGELERGLRQIDAVIVADLGAGERAAHLAGIAAGDIDKGERLGKRGERAVQDRADFFMGERVGYPPISDRSPIASGTARARLGRRRRPSSGSDECGCSFRCASASLEEAFYCNPGCTKVSATRLQHDPDIWKALLTVTLADQLALGHDDRTRARRPPPRGTGSCYFCL